MKTFLRRLGQFIQNSHGVQYFRKDDKDSTFGRVVWTIVLIGAYCFLGYFFYIRVLTFLDYEATTKVTYTTQKDKIPIPTLTLCPIDSGIVPSRVTVNDVIYEDNIRLLSPRKDSVTFMKNGQRFLNATAQDFFRRLLNDSSLINSDEATEYWEEDLLFNTRYHMLDCVGSCLNWRPMVAAMVEYDSGKPLKDIEEHGDYDLLENAGMTINEVVSGELSCFDGNGAIIYNCSNWKVDMVIVSGTRKRCFTTEFPMETVSALSSLNNFVMDGGLYAPAYKWGKIIVDIGTVHEVKTWARKGKSYNAKLGEVTHIKRLGVPHGPHCGDEESPGAIGKKYSKKNCISTYKERCKERILVEQLGCRGEVVHMEKYRNITRCIVMSIPSVDRLNTINQCSVPESDPNVIQSSFPCPCYFNEEPDESQCPDSACDELYFRFELEAKPFFTEDRLEVIFTRNDDQELTVYEEIALYPVESLLAELGGTMGLFVGISVLTILQCLEHVLREVAMKLGKSSKVMDNVLEVMPAQDMQRESQSAILEMKRDMEQMQKHLTYVTQRLIDLNKSNS